MEGMLELFFLSCCNEGRGSRCRWGWNAVDQEGDSLNNYTKDCMVAISVPSYLKQAWIHSIDCRAPHCGGSGESMYRFGRGSQTPACRACTAASYHPYSWTACIFNIVERRESGPEPPCNNASSAVLARAGTGTRRANAIGESDPSMRRERSASSEEYRPCYISLP
jgi:hypothetical protein